MIAVCGWCASSSQHCHHERHPFRTNAQLSRLQTHPIRKYYDVTKGSTVYLPNVWHHNNSVGISKVFAFEQSIVYSNAIKLKEVSHIDCKYACWRMRVVHVRCTKLRAHLWPKLGRDTGQALLRRLANVVDGQAGVWMLQQRQHVVTVAPDLLPQRERLQKLDVAHSKTRQQQQQRM